MSPLLMFHSEHYTFRFHLAPVEHGGMEPRATMQMDPGKAGEPSVFEEVALADLVVLGHAAQGALDARRATKGLDS